jgi:hypothetical protein
MRGFTCVLAAAFAAMSGSVSAQTDAPAMSPIEVRVACAPPTTAEDSGAGQPLKLLGAQDTMARGLFGVRDLVVVNGGTAAGVQLGQRFYVRRNHRAMGLHSTRTLGWVRVIAVNESTAIAAVEHSCGGLLTDDYLAPFVPPVVPAGAERLDVSGEPDFASLARVVSGDEGRDTIATGEFAVIDRGSDEGVQPGARFAVYRDLHAAGLPLASVAEAVVVSTGPSQSVARIVGSRDAVRAGDYVAFRK